MQFNAKSTATQVASAFANHIKGKTVLITGVSPGSIGEYTALSIAAHQPKKLILASRTIANIQDVSSTILNKFPLSKIQQLKLDLSVQSAVRDSAAEFNETNDVLDILINNAGIMALPDRTMSKDGIELQFATNHIGHFLFTNLILGKLRAAKTARIINVTSNGHRFSPVRFDDMKFEGHALPTDQQPGLQKMIDRGLKLKWKGHYEPFVAYGQSKTANILFSLYLRDRLASAGILSFSVHPGTILTNLARSMFTGFWIRLIGIIWMTYGTWMGRHKTVDGGAATSVFAAFEPSLNENTCIYLQDCAEGSPESYATDLLLAERLWSVSEELVNQRFSL